MFYLAEIEDYVRVEPKLFGLRTLDAVKQQLKETYSDYVSKELGAVISVVDVLEVGDGIVIPGDGAAYYKSTFKLLVWKPELQEITYAIVDEITNFGAFMDMGVMNGMIHISQTMEDYVSFSKSNTLVGKASKKTIKKGDSCLARIVAISFKSGDPKIGLTMRQPGLGKMEWVKDDKRRAIAAAKKAERLEKQEKKKK
ncbi:DNA-directed RNA polymerase [Candidatus Pacearchaeota archaeon]|nr:DNA-directed RNA polymerase [Candidatus Pacearchaeota archaeon]